MLNSAAYNRQANSKKETPLDDKEKENNSALGFYFELVWRPHHTPRGDLSPMDRRDHYRDKKKLWDRTYVVLTSAGR